MNASEQISLEDVTGGKFSAKIISGINPIEGTDEYAQISQDGKQIVKYSFKTGEQTGILFDVAHTQGVSIKEFDGYVLSPDGQTLLIETAHKRIYRRSYTAEYYIYKVKDHSLEPLSTGGPQQIPTFSPDSRRIAFVRENNIFITNGNQESQITTDGKFNEVINGIPDWVNEEEFSFNNALAWNADGSSLSWIRYDETRVKTYSLQLFKGMKPSKDEFADYPGAYSYKYPKAGQENSTVSVWSYNLLTKQIQQLHVPLDTDGYIPRIKTTKDKDRIIIYTMNRHQDVLCLYAASPKTGECRLLIRESVPKYVKEEAMENIKITAKYILLPSDRDGFMHLYLYNSEGKLLRQVEKGNYEVTDVYGIDEQTGNVYYQAATPSPMNREVFVAKKNGQTRSLSPRKGWNSAIFSGDFRYFIHTWSDCNHPYIFSICTNEGKTMRTMLDNQELSEKLSKYKLAEKEFFQLTTSEGITLNGWMIKPADFDESRQYPVVMHQYSGPGSQQVADRWSIGSMGQGGLFDYYLAQKGFIIATVDGRGTGARGADFEKCTYLKLGELESRDQVEAALWLSRQSFVDSTRIGIWGWSFGGFCTLMSMSEGRPVFRAGVAIAPPTNWKFYDSVYTERYMQTPQENPDGYAINPINRAAKLHGSLLICHGVADDNVHPQNTFEYSEALVQADKDFRELLYTNRNHSIYGGNTRLHLLRQVAEHFERELK